MIKLILFAVIQLTALAASGWAGYHWAKTDAEVRIAAAQEAAESATKAVDKLRRANEAFEQEASRKYDRLRQAAAVAAENADRRAEALKVRLEELHREYEKNPNWASGLVPRGVVDRLRRGSGGSDEDSSSGGARGEAAAG